MLFLSPLLLALGLTSPVRERPVVLKATTLLDGRGGVQKNAVVVVSGSRIVQVGGTPPAGALTIDLEGLTLTPGLIDTHSHILWHFNKGRLAADDEPPAQAAYHAARNAELTLDAGFTTIQSPGSPEDKFLRDAIAEGEIPGPRIRTSLQPLSEESGPPEKLRELVRERKAQGADLIKLFASKSIREGGAQTMTDAQLEAACSEAKSLGLRTLVHAHSAESAKAASLAGCTTIEHGVFVTDEVFDLMASRGTYYDPNIGLVLQNYLENKEKFLGIGNYTEEGFASMEKAVGIALETFKRALRHKDLKIVYGTDAVAGAHGRNYEEFLVRVQKGGMDPGAAIVSATSLSAESMGMGGEIGSIAPQMQADMVAFRGNPLTDPTAVSRAVFVMKGGRIMKAPGTPSAGSR
jgi:imidazolonepropionase-like amidohydrolase